MNNRLQTIKYLAFDFLGATLAWILFYGYRKLVIEPSKFGYDIPLELDYKFVISLLFIPCFWVVLYYITGYYKRIYRKSRLRELGQTLFTSLVGIIVIFFVLILDDTIQSYVNYYQSLIRLFSFHFILTYIPRLIITTNAAHKIHRNEIGFNTLLIGSNENAVKLFGDLKSQPRSAGFKFIGFINILDKRDYLLSSYLTHLGSVDDLNSIVKENNVEEAIIALESSEHGQIFDIINKLKDVDIMIKVLPDMYDILTGSVKMSSIFGTPLIQISHDIMPIWQENLKRIIDVLASIFALTVLSPLYMFLAIGVKFSSKGPFLYNHERIGRYGKPFTIYKFRSMMVNAEENGPALSSDNDSRITTFGKFMRKSRLDEVPQFYNVLIGDMSIVGPRPERQYFIDKILQEANHYTHLHKVRPGITSWGQVKYGYAENVDEMVERLKYDLIYIENMSLYVDFKIMIYTVLIILKGAGK